MNNVNEFIKELKKILKEVGGEAYLVGGFVRDKLISPKIEPKDIHIIYEGHMDRLISNLEVIGYKFFPLKDSLEIYTHNTVNYIFHIAKMKGKNIEEDLSKRDFTINTICIKLIENKIIDPFKGRRAIEARIIQHVNENSIEEDPVRILRGFKLYIKYGMHFNLETENKVIELSPKLKNCDKERIFNEFMKIIEIDNEGKAFQLLDDYNVLKNIFPYIEELKTVGKCTYHTENAFTHMNLTYGVFKDIIKGRINIAGIELIKLEEYIGNFKLKEYIALACFLHDIGKFNCHKEEDNNVSFIGHEKEGAKTVYGICEYMKFPEKAAVLVKIIVEAHMYPLQIFKADIKEKRKELYKLFVKYNKYVPFILLVSFCDNYATTMHLESNNEKKEYKKFIEYGLIEYKAYNEIISKK